MYGTFRQDSLIKSLRKELEKDPYFRETKERLDDALNLYDFLEFLQKEVDGFYDNNGEYQLGFDWEDDSEENFNKIESLLIELIEKKGGGDLYLGTPESRKKEFFEDSVDFFHYLSDRLDREFKYVLSIIKRRYENVLAWYTLTFDERTGR